MKRTTLIGKKTVRGRFIEYEYICDTNTADKLVKRFPENYSYKEVKKEVPTSKAKNAEPENKKQ